MNDVTILATNLRFPEGPTFDNEGKIWCVEQEGEDLFCRYPDGQTKRVHTGGRPNGSALDPSGEWLYFCDSGFNAIRRLHLGSTTIETVVSELNGKPLNMPNDLVFDNEGNLLFTCPGPSDSDDLGYVAVHTTDGSVYTIADGLDYPNGLAILPNGRSLLVAETKQQRIWCGHWDSKALSWESIDVWANIRGNYHGPDGLAVAPNGDIYVAGFGSGQIQVLNEDGKPIRVIDLPGSNPTNCTFSPDGHCLVVTEAEKGMLLCCEIN